MPPLRIAFDLQSFFTGSRLRGLGRYAFEVAREISLTDEGLGVRLVGRGDDPQGMDLLRREFAHLPASSITHITTSRIQPAAITDWRVELDEHLFRRHMLMLDADVVHVPSPFEHEGVRLPTPWPTSNTLLCATAHDLIPLVYADEYLADPGQKAYYLSRLRTLHDAELVFANSEATKGDLVSLLGLDASRIVVTLLGVDPKFRRRSMSSDARRSLLERFGIRNKFIMYLGAWDFRKNMNATIAAFAKLPEPYRQEYSLVLTCASSVRDQAAAEQLARKSGLPRGALVMTGQVSDDDLIDLYSACDLFIYPSLYEGFGLPVLEAMACGAPVMTSNCSSLPEVVGRADATFDPSTPESIADGLMRALGSPGFTAELARYGPERANLFSWRRCARETLDAFKEGVERKQARPLQVMAARPPRRRLAIVASRDASRAGISDALLTELARFLELDLFEDPGSARSDYVASNIRRFATDAALEPGRAYDAFVVTGSGEPTPEFERSDERPWIYALNLDTPPGAQPDVRIVSRLYRELLGARIRPAGLIVPAVALAPAREAQQRAPGLAVIGVPYSFEPAGQERDKQSNLAAALVNAVEELISLDASINEGAQVQRMAALARLHGVGLDEIARKFVDFDLSPVAA